MPARLTTEEFITRAKKIHGGFYDYSKVEYNGAQGKIIITCVVHGDFCQTAYSHLQGRGCPECSGLKRYTTREFINKARNIHKNLYLYDKVVYINNKTPIIITCPTHGDFGQTPHNHLQGRGCPDCANAETSRRQLKTTKKFVAQARKVHGNFYSYEKVEYTGSDTPVIITCPIHGDFHQVANSHLQGRGCPDCANVGTSRRQLLTTKKFVTQARKVHGNFYSYEKVEYRGTSKKVIITCPIHGDFEQRPNGHLRGQGCFHCGKIKRSRSLLYTTEEFIAKAREIHEDFYSYKKVNHIHSNTSVIITCPIHGDFEQKPISHLSGKGCQSCGRERASNSNRYSAKEFITKSKVVHGNFYNYSKVNYIRNDIAVIIECPIHGDFKQKPTIHLGGHGCPSCNQSSGEQRIAEFLDNLNISYTQEKRFDNCRSKKPLPFDFHFSINGMNFLIEYDGVHHFEPVTNWGGQDRLALVQYHDAIKDDFADQHDYILIRVPYTANDIEAFLQEKLEKYIPHFYDRCHRNPAADPWREEFPL